MMTDLRISLVARDARQRAAICHALLGSDIHVEPFENLDEFIGDWRSGSSILVEDSGNDIFLLMDHMSVKGGWQPIIGFTEAPTPQRIVRAIANGAAAYVDWPISADDIRDAVQTAQASISKGSKLRMREANARSRLQCLTRREKEVLTAVANGLPNRSIADNLGISPRTVEIHRANMILKIGANHTSDAIRLAIEASLV